MGRLYRAVEVSSGVRSAYTVGFIDTGADQSIISESLANRIRADLRGYIDFISASGHLITGRIALVRITTLADRNTAELEVGVSEELFREDIDENGVEVIIGLDFLQSTNAKIQF